jgi:hypothetical protein
VFCKSGSDSREERTPEDPVIKKYGFVAPEVYEIEVLNFWALDPAASNNATSAEHEI